MNIQSCPPALGALDLAGPEPLLAGRWGGLTISELRALEAVYTDAYGADADQDPDATGYRGPSYEAAGLYRDLRHVREGHEHYADALCERGATLAGVTVAEIQSAGASLGIVVWHSYDPLDSGWRAATGNWDDGP